ncbi:hypothetical protein GDO86_004879 [Hymenochirus boettgeri]|uniref:Uncharacterized protein n=1 Tax=Hymenochirus boettgeri TaxID=247094 RepID=A0A8T2IZU2_9PIPI|nr:hypothetical protein GDO86_004879 [Hymenochirus boettgeri]
MPRRSASHGDTRKTRLCILKAQAGSASCDGSPPDKSAHPVCAPTRSLDHNTVSSWVMMLFILCRRCPHNLIRRRKCTFPARRRLRHLSSNSSMQIRTRDPNHSDLRASGTRSSAYKFPTLSFTRRRGAELNRRNFSLCETKNFVAVYTEQGRLSPLPQREYRAQISQAPLMCGRQNSKKVFLCQVPERATETLKKIAGGYASPVPGGSEEVLARDTPEHEYGLRITWRRRQELMKYLKARGRLKSSQMVVKT